MFVLKVLEKRVRLWRRRLHQDRKPLWWNERLRWLVRRKRLRNHQRRSGTISKRKTARAGSRKEDRHLWKSDFRFRRHFYSVVGIVRRVGDDLQGQGVGRVDVVRQSVGVRQSEGWKGQGQRHRKGWGREGLNLMKKQQILRFWIKLFWFKLGFIFFQP